MKRQSLHKELNFYIFSFTLLKQFKNWLKSQSCTRPQRSRRRLVLNGVAASFALQSA
jgi:hypothetical protein